VASATLRRAQILLFFLLILSCFYQSGCQRPLSPEELYAHVRGEAQRGDLDAALRDADRAYQQLSSKDENSDRAWQFRVLKAHVLVMRGASAEALRLLRDELPVSLAKSETTVRKKMVSGLAHEYMQQFDAAKEDLQEAESLARTFQPKLLGDVEQSKGLLEVDRGNYAAAEADFHTALSIAREQRQPYLEATALGALGNSAMNQEHFDAAIDWYKKALALAQSLGSKSSVAKALGNLGWSNFQLGDFENALTLYQQGVDASQRSGLIADRIYWLTGVAKSQFALRNYAAAGEGLGQALELAEKQDDKRIRNECLNDLSLLELGTGRVELARKHNQEALEIEQAGFDQAGILGTKLLRARILGANRDFPQAEQAFQELIQDPKTEQSVRWEAQAYLAKVYEDENLPSDAEREFIDALRTIQTVRSSVDEEEFRLSFLSSGIEFYSDYINFLVSRGRAEDALRVADLSRGQTLSEGLSDGKETTAKSPKRVQPQQLAQRMGATLLVYWLGERASYLWVITPTKTTQFVLPGSLEIDPVVKAYREALLGMRDPLEMANPAGQKLYNVLVEPAKKLIPHGSRVVVLPDGSLYGLNFETLIVPEPKQHYWIEDVTLTTGSSLTLLASAASRAAPKDKSLFLVGDTVQPNEDFPRLQQAPAEMKNIEKYFPESRRRVLSGDQATPATYLGSQPEEFAYLHFVTHGIASRARPLESAVILSKEKDEDSYKLYAREIVKRRLSAYLVTISACNGAGARTYSGEGLLGLSWAFVRAGAHNVISALWEVSDTSTPQLMDKLYSGLSQGKDPALALRAAKLSLLRSDSVYKKPFYWAPFQLYAGS
jgi:CHAT domain-containing protein